MDSSSIHKWRETVASFERLSRSVWWAKGFSLHYYLRTFSRINAGSPGYWKNVFYQFASAAYRLSKISMSIFMKKSAYNNNGYIFLTDNNPNYLATIEPVIEETLKRVAKVSILTPGPGFFEKPQKADKFFGKYNSDIVICEDLFRQVGPVKRITLFFTAFVASFVDTWKFLRSGIKHTVYFAFTFYRFALIHRTYRHCIAIFLENCKVIVACNDYHMWESLIFQSTTPSTRTVILQHGFLGEFASPLFAKKFLSWSHEDKKRIVSEIGAEPEGIVVAGSPKFDQLLYINQHGPPSEGEKKYITFLSQSHGAGTLGLKAYIEIVRMFYRLADGFTDNGYQFQIKLHPFDDAHFFRDIQRHHDVVIPLVKEDISHVMRESLASITVSSTAIYESVIYGCIPIQVYVQGIRRFDDYSATGLTFLCRNYDSLVRALSRLVRDDVYADDIRQRSRDSLLGKHLAHVGNSGRFIAEYLIDPYATVEKPL